MWAVRCDVASPPDARQGQPGRSRHTFMVTEDGATVKCAQEILELQDKGFALPPRRQNFLLRDMGVSDNPDATPDIERQVPYAHARAAARAAVAFPRRFLRLAAGGSGN